MREDAEGGPSAGRAYSAGEANAAANPRTERGGEARQKGSRPLAAVEVDCALAGTRGASGVHGYDQKDDRYFAQVNEDLISIIPHESSQSVLDVGCGDGSLGAALKERGWAGTVVGVECAARPASRARARLDAVHEVDVERWAPPQRYRKYFDCVVCGDVLEHLRDPWAALRMLGDLLSEDGVLAASIPNVRHVSVVIPLLVRGRWDYAERGVLDTTHTRFFTKRSMVALFTSCGYEIDLLRPRLARLPRALGWIMRPLAQLLGGACEEFAAVKYLIRARARSSG